MFLYVFWSYCIYQTSKRAFRTGCWLKTGLFFVLNPNVIHPASSHSGHDNQPDSFTRRLQQLLSEKVLYWNLEQQNDAYCVLIKKYFTGTSAGESYFLKVMHYNIALLF